MRLRTKLTLVIGGAVVVPLAASAAASLAVYQRDVERRALETVSTVSAGLAAQVEQTVEAGKQGFVLAARSIRWDHLTPEERSGALWLVYRQLEELSALTLLDSHGRAIGASVFIAEPSADPDLAAHPLASLTDLEAFANNIPFATALADEVVVSPPYVARGATVPSVAIAVAVDGPSGERWVIAGSFSLRAVLASLQRVALAGGGAVLVADSSILLRHGLVELPAALTGTPLEALAATGGQARINASTMDVIAAFVPVAGGVLRTGVLQESSQAFAATRTVTWQALGWLGGALLLAVMAGLLLGRALARNLAHLVEGAQRVAGGDFSERVTIGGEAEINDLGEAFNRMVFHIERRDAEIRAWNEELQQRVDARTKELREAQKQIIRSEKLAAVSSLAAGMAHEINNPLTGVVGLTQVLLKSTPQDVPAYEQLKLIERESQRIARIVMTLTDLDSSRPYSGHTRVRLHEIAEEALRLMENQRAEKKVRTEPILNVVPTISGDASELRQALLHLFQNACNAMPDGGVLRIETRSLEDGSLVQITVADTGVGIPPDRINRVFEPFYGSKEKWDSVGLGLSRVHRIVAEHEGRISVESEVGQGTTMTLTFPASAAGAHLV